MTLAGIYESYELKNERLGFIPESFLKTSFEEATVSETDAHELFQDLHIRYIPLWSFYAQGLTLQVSKPVSVCLSKGERLFFAENENLGICATGENLGEAIQDFGEQLVYFYKHYSRLQWDQVTGDAGRLKELYEESFYE